MYLRITVKILLGVLTATAYCQVALGVQSSSQEDEVASPKATNVTGEEKIVGKPCEGCEAVFRGLPDKLSSTTRIAPEDEPGKPLRLVGKVVDLNGNAVEGIVVYAYHTNAKGIYPPDEELRGTVADRHGRLRGWALTDQNGEYTFHTIRPASYPDTDLPQHIHMHIIEPGRCTYYIDDILFRDDPRLSENALNEETHGRGGSGVTDPARDQQGVWQIRRNIVLGKNVPGYPARPQSSGSEESANEMGQDKLSRFQTPVWSPNGH